MENVDVNALKMRIERVLPMLNPTFRINWKIVLIF
jgi:hypothetical protein